MRSDLSHPRFLDRSTPPHIATLVLLSGLAAMSMNIFLPSLPGMAAYFDAPYRTVQLSVSLYLLFSAVLQLVIGPLADRYGRRPVILGALGLFLLCTIGTILAPNVEVFLAFRTAQAIIATGFVLSRAVVRDIVPEAQAASMIGYVTMGMSLVPMVSPALGGILDEAFGWKANFVLLFVLGIAVSALVWADLGETAPKGAGSLVAQVRLYPTVLRSRRFWGYSVAAAAGSGAFFAFLGGAPYVATVVFGMGASQLGLWFAAPAIGYLLGNFLSGRFAARIGIVRMVFWGTSVVAVAMGVLLLFTLAGLEGPIPFFGLIAITGLGNGMALPSANSGMMSVRPDLAATASGLGGALTIGGGAALAALAGPALNLGGGSLPLVGLMFASSLVGMMAIGSVVRRNRQLGL
jgi:DHA1 family bicyclomycin/chloramphenicol resistance-like MFS transporter